MRRFAYIAFHFATAVSFVLFLAIILLWVRSYRAVDVVLRASINHGDTGYGYTSGLGELTLRRVVLSRPVWGNEGNRKSFPMTAQMQQDYQRWIDQNTSSGFGWQRLEVTHTAMNYSESSKELTLPYWLLLLYTAVFPSVLIFRRARARRRQRPSVEVQGLQDGKLK
jgi:hypothetical protein